MKATSQKWKRFCLTFAYRVEHSSKKVKLQLAQSWLEDGRAVAKAKGVGMDKLAQLAESLSRLNSAELKLVLKFAEWLKEQASELAH